MTAKLKLDLDVAGFGKVAIDGVELDCVTSISLRIRPGNLTEVTLTILTDVDASIEAALNQIALKKEQPEVKTVRALDGREIPVRSRTPV